MGVVYCTTLYTTKRSSGHRGFFYSHKVYWQFSSMVTRSQPVLASHRLQSFIPMLSHFFRTACKAGKVSGNEATV